MASTRILGPRNDLVLKGLLGLLNRGEVTVEAIERNLGRDLVTGCPCCRERTATGVALLLDLPRRPVGGWLGVSATAAKERRGKKRQGGPQGDTLARLAVERVKAVAVEQRPALVEREHYSFRGPAVARAFLAEALAALPGDPKESSLWAALAGLAAGFDSGHCCEDDAEQVVLFLRSELYRANASHCLGELEQADTDIEQVVFDAHQLGVRDALFWAEAKSFATAIKRDRRQFDDALQQGYLAAAIWTHLGDASRVARSQAQIASIHEQRGEFLLALAAVQEACRLASRLEEPALVFTVRHSEVGYLVRTGRAREAAIAFGRLQPDYEKYPHKENFRQWAAGLIAAGLEKPEDAESAFHAARDGFLSAENPYDAALVTLDWTLFLLDQNRPEEVLPLAASMGQAFEALGVARETLASWAIFQTAAERRELSRAVAESMVRTLGEERAGAKSGR